MQNKKHINASQHFLIRTKISFLTWSETSESPHNASLRILTRTTTETPDSFHREPLRKKEFNFILPRETEQTKLPRHDKGKRPKRKISKRKNEIWTYASYRRKENRERKKPARLQKNEIGTPKLTWKRRTKMTPKRGEWSQTVTKKTSTNWHRTKNAATRMKTVGGKDI